MAVDLSSVVSFATKALGELPGLLAAGANVIGLISKTRESLNNMSAENRGPTAQEWDDLDAEVNKLRQQLHSP